MAMNGNKKIEALETEVVVVGSGGAGLPAAVAAVEKGVNVILLEKLHFLGGNALIASQRRYGDDEGLTEESAESRAQRIKAIYDQQDDIFEQAMEWSHWRMDGELIRTLIEKSGDNIRWLGDQGVKFEVMDMADEGTPLPRPFINLPVRVQLGPGASFGAVVKGLTKKCEELGVQILRDTGAKKLLTNQEGKIIGVLAEAKDRELRVSAKSVILATGGFIGNKELMKKYFHSYDDDIYEDMHLIGLPHTGDGLLMATEIGAATDGTVAFEWCNHRFHWSPRIDQFLNSPYPIWVNIKGKRFTDESTIDASNSVYRQPRKAFYVLFDEKIKQLLYEDKNVTEPAKMEEEFRLHADKGRIKISDSWDEIAEFMGAKPEVLKTAIEQYNSSCDKGHDTLFIKHPDCLVPLRTPPYYAFQCCLNMLLTRGPLKVNSLMEVVDKNDDPIPGLYAAGVDIGGTDSDTYWGTGSGHSFGFAIGSGRIAGEGAARLIKGE